MPVERFGSHFLQNGLINLISLPVCHIFNALSVDTHIGYRNSHNAIWSYGSKSVFFRISFVKQKVDVGRLGSKKMLWCIK